jgi:hypothetical protein
MKLPILAALALIPLTSLQAQTVADYSTATPIGGSWSYVQTADGSEARFLNASALPQVTIHCTRATRRVSIAKPATAAAPFIAIWTSSQSRSAPASFNPATNRLTADFGAYDAFLDALVFSRGRAAFTVGAAPALVVPVWSEVSRVIEDCRV